MAQLHHDGVRPRREELELQLPRGVGGRGGDVRPADLAGAPERGRRPQADVGRDDGLLVVVRQRSGDELAQGGGEGDAAVGQRHRAADVGVEEDDAGAVGLAAGVRGGEPQDAARIRGDEVDRDPGDEALDHHQVRLVRGVEDLRRDGGGDRQRAAPQIHRHRAGAVDVGVARLPQAGAVGAGKVAVGGGEPHPPLVGVGGAGDLGGDLDARDAVGGDGGSGDRQHQSAGEVG